MKAQFTTSYGTTYQAYTNEKQYGPKRVVYIEITKLLGVQGPSRSKGSYSIAGEQFVDFKAGELNEMKLAARALGITE